MVRSTGPATLDGAGSDGAGNDSPARTKHAAVVYNPVKVDEARLRAVVDDHAAQAGWGATEWFATSADDPGRAATTDALSSGPSAVIAAGGDGTVRAVAETLAGGDVPIVLVPAGTGNLLARNLDLDVEHPARAVAAAFAGTERTIDLGRATLRGADGGTSSHVFVVMAGTGLDARMLAETDEDLKSKAGWLAYVSAITKVLKEKNTLHVVWSLDRGDVRRGTANTIIVGNCGTLAGDILLLPEAAVDDGELDVLVLRPEGARQWIAVVLKVLVENALLARTPLGKFFSGRRIQAVRYDRARRCSFEFRQAQPVELDGDVVGDAVRLEVVVDPGALRVLVPASEAGSSEDRSSASASSGSGSSGSASSGDRS